MTMKERKRGKIWNWIIPLCQRFSTNVSQFIVSGRCCTLILSLWKWIYQRCHVMPVKIHRCSPDLLKGNVALRSRSQTIADSQKGNDLFPSTSALSKLWLRWQFSNHVDYQKKSCPKCSPEIFHYRSNSCQVTLKERLSCGLVRFRKTVTGRKSDELGETGIAISGHGRQLTQHAVNTLWQKNTSKVQRQSLKGH